MIKKILYLATIAITVCFGTTGCSDDSDYSEYPTPENMEQWGSYQYPTLDGRTGLLVGPIRNACLISSWWEEITPAYLQKIGVPFEKIHFGGRYSFDGYNANFPHWAIVELPAAAGSLSEVRAAAGEAQIWVSPLFGTNLQGSKCATELAAIRIKADRLDDWNAYIGDYDCELLLRYSPGGNTFIVAVPRGANGLSYAAELLKLDFVEGAEPLFTDTYGRLYNTSFPL